MSNLRIPTRTADAPTVSVVTAFYNELQNLPLFRARVTEMFDTLQVRGEIVLLDDHSTDGSDEVAKQWASEDARVKYVRLSRNSGSHAAFSAGLSYCTGDCAVLLAADLQDPPETVRELLERWREGSDVGRARRAPFPSTWPGDALPAPEAATLPPAVVARRGSRAVAVHAVYALRLGDQSD